MRKKMNNIMFVAMVGVMGALVFAASYISIRLDFLNFVGDPPRLHLGNIMCLLAGLILGPIPGGIAAGVGSMFYDFTNPAYFASAPFTLAFKFLMAFVCGQIAWGGGKQAKSFKRNIVAGVLGQLTYIILYLGKAFVSSLFFHKVEMQTALISLVVKAVTSTINGIFAVVIAVPLSFALRKGLEQANLHGLRNIH
jgi:uncharacterized membrane protein